jgi:uracil-DNA glycosylase
MAAIEPKTGGEGASPDTAVLPDRFSVLALAAALRTSLRFHDQMGINNYPSMLQSPPRRKKETKAPAKGHIGLVRTAAAPAPNSASAQPWAKEVAESQLIALRHDLEICGLCALAAARQGVVPGSGTAGSQLLVVGDYSSQDTGFSAAIGFGAAEDAMLWNMMRAIGLTPDDVYVTNAVKCCSLPTEMAEVECMQHCRKHLLREIELVRPRVICAMGELAAQAVLGGKESVFRRRGRFHRYQAGEDWPQVMVTFHPRFLLNNAELKKAAWQDLQLIQRLLQAV